MYLWKNCLYFPCKCDKIYGEKLSAFFPQICWDFRLIFTEKGAFVMFASAYVWAKVISHMEERLGAVTVSAWFDDAEVVELNEEQLIIYSASDFRREIIRRRCTDYIQDALKEIFNSDAKLVVFGDEELAAYRAKDNNTTSMDFNPQFTFDNFVVGPSNRFAHGAAIAVSNNPGQVYNPLFIYGPAGVGRLGEVCILCVQQITRSMLLMGGLSDSISKSPLPCRIYGSQLDRSKRRHQGCD